VLKRTETIHKNDAIVRTRFNFISKKLISDTFLNYPRTLCVIERYSGNKQSFFLVVAVQIVRIQYNRLTKVALHA
jgi:hypothetical protein